MPGIRITERMAGWIRFGETPSSFKELEGVQIDIQYPFEINILSFCNQFKYPFPFKFRGGGSFSRTFTSSTAY